MLLQVVHVATVDFKMLAWLQMCYSLNIRSFILEQGLCIRIMQKAWKISE
jgi:hypothetical protein